MRSFVRVGYCVSEVVVVVEFSQGIARVCGGINYDVAIEISKHLNLIGEILLVVGHDSSLTHNRLL